MISVFNCAPRRLAPAGAVSVEAAAAPWAKRAAAEACLLPGFRGSVFLAGQRQFPRQLRGRPSGRCGSIPERSSLKSCRERGIGAGMLQIPPGPTRIQSDTKGPLPIKTTCNTTPVRRKHAADAACCFPDLGAQASGGFWSDLPGVHSFVISRRQRRDYSLDCCQLHAASVTANAWPGKYSAVYTHSPVMPE